MRNDERLAQQHRQMVELDQFLIRLLRVQLHSIGCKPEAADWCVKENVPEISDLYRRWLEHTAFVLKEQPPIGAGDSGELWKEWDRRMQQWLADENMQAKALLADTMLKALPDILTGRRSATDIMFPNASMRLVEGVYKQNLIADHFNEVVAEQAVKHVQQVIGSGRRQGLRILEIGAGTGGTSEMLLSRFSPYGAHIQEYGYTDISKSFLSYAKTKYKDQYPYLAYHILNIEEPIAEQNLAVGQYDLVVATNVLHATRNIRQTLRNAKALLKCKGVLLINEITENSLFNHVTFGLLKGWWLYEDEEVRLPGCPALSPEMWNVVLEQEGFESVAYPAADADFLGQQVIAAVSDGIVRQMRNAAPGGAAQEAGLAAIAAPSDQASQAKQADLAKQANQAAAGEEGDSANRLSHKQLRQKGRAYFKKLIGEILEVEADSMDAGEALEMYGMDSILIIQLTDRLNKVMNEHVSSTIFFEYSTIDALVDYFMQTRQQALAAMVGAEEAEAAPPQDAGDIDQRSDASMMKRPVAVTVRPAASASGSKDIAVIGLAGRYPQADHMGEFWENLKRGKHCITEIPEARWNWREHYHPEKGRKGSTYSKWGGFVRGIDTFDPLFFHISPKEAEQMDPQERQFLQIVYSSIEDAGYIPEALSRSRKVGVFVGIMNGNYPTGASYWSVANRVSYCLNFTGPSLAVDTACSSSLTAVHLALESLYSGTSDCAIAGGVNFIVDPVHYVRLSEKTMLSGGDQCRAFGDWADGFVGGEGIGAVVLKPLQLAEADGDHIYGVLKGSAINAGGKVKGYTVPNPAIQSQVVMEAIRRAEVDPRAISYVEAHGTGTALGDPIEIEGLRRAFEHNTLDKQFCAIGSVKSNIGHCESAAGIAGLSKILLQLKHGQLAPSLHAEALNPNIQFGETPFYVQQELSEWKRPVIECDGVLREAPRIAGISSFGAGGANAHVIVQEYIPDRAMLPAKAASPPGKPHMIVLSAQNMDRLRARASQLLHAVAAGIYADGQLGDIAYTLQTGRVAMEARLAFIACSLEELEQQLNRFIAGQAEQEKLIFGEVQSRKEAVAELAADEAMQEMVASWIRDQKYAQLLKIWAKGFEIDWDACYGSDRPSRIGLPAYPFAEERYWFPARQDKKDADEGQAVSPSVGVLHPLLHRNTSHLLEQRFSSEFNGREFFLSDHRVNNVRVLPGAAQLEMALAAVARAAPPDGANAGVALTNVVWARPVTVKQEPVSVHIGLHLDQNREIGFEIYGVPEQGEETVLYSQGRATLTGKPESRRIDISAVKQLCDKGMLTSGECYAAFAKMGLFYGERHRGIERLYLGRNQVLARLTLPASVSDTLQAYTLHPVLIDSAFQASLGLTLDLMQRQLLPHRPPLPFALQRLEMPGGCVPAMWARVQYSVPRGADDGVMKLDIDLCDESGNVCVHMQGFTTRLYSAEGGSYAQEQALAQVRDSAAEAAVSSSDPPAARVLVLAPVWEAFHVDHPQHRQDLLSVSTAKPLFIGGKEDLLETLRAAVPDASAAYIPENASAAQIKRILEAFGGRIRHIVWVASTPVPAVRAGAEHSPVRRQESELIQVFRLTKSLLQLGFGSRELDLTAITFQAEAVYPHDRANPGQAAVHGFMGSLAKEYPNWNIRVADLEAAEGCKVQDILSLPPDPLGNAYVYREEEWYRQELVPVEYAPLRHTVYRRSGVYVVIGGAGGIGEVWSEYMIRTYQARIVWIGRKNKDAVIQAKLDRLAAAGPQPAYIQANAADLSELQRAYERIRGQYSRIDGIVHSALVLSDRSVANMEEEEFRAALAAKLDVSVNMAHVFRKEEPDFVLFFSSLNSFLKLPGQSNYVSGCTYADAFARQLSLEWPCPVKVMNWGYWGSVGSVASAQIRHSMEQKGIGSIEPAEANQALEQLLAGPLDQIVMMKTIKRPDLPALNESKTVTVFR
ncbi:type I polyketide synthase [Paenibacillus ehimensis]|uniref:type I polyketide synthase n=1 Tax=Paenibacillus ehimensis TaxID=79264 RepID=UPI002DBFB4D0|nr:type I polyketide synthase [Paenibacillus ehimensis]MEC0210943.1 type I polyketide synthase [Paenibacillus ehimensis]